MCKRYMSLVKLYGKSLQFKCYIYCTGNDVSKTMFGYILTSVNQHHPEMFQVKEHLHATNRYKPNKI